MLRDSPNIRSTKSTTNASSIHPTKRTIVRSQQTGPPNPSPERTNITASTLLTAGSIGEGNSYPQPLRQGRRADQGTGPAPSRDPFPSPKL
ncbi:hypothetical protein BGZ60DRAFT_421167 [Tricladium varicosporioides]|nr:hypothetical protein BGZ60DRAFT_421167 [Hymenoscyphus varicosporioides]